MDGGNLVLSDDLIDGEQEAQKCLVLSNGHMILNGLCNFEITEMLVYSSNIDSNLDFFFKFYGDARVAAALCFESTES